jgi:hypothetical protein
VFANDERTQVRERMPMLRQQRDPKTGKPLLCLADFVAPLDAQAPDWIGGFAVTAGVGVDDVVARFEREHDDYSAILVKSLADRLAEAFAEMLHLRVRREWYAPEESLAHEDLVKERYRGIRPAPGYPACPDHTEKATLWRLLDAERAAGIRLTESYAMHPASSVSGIYLAISPSARSGATRWKATRAARGSAWPRPNAGSGPTWGTTPRVEPESRDHRLGASPSSGLVPIGANQSVAAPRAPASTSTSWQPCAQVHTVTTFGSGSSV